MNDILELVEIPQQTHPLLTYKFKQEQLDKLKSKYETDNEKQIAINHLERYGIYYLYLLCIHGYYAILSNFDHVFDENKLIVLHDDICQEINITNMISYEDFSKYKKILSDINDDQQLLTIDIGCTRIQIDEIDKWDPIIEYVDKLENKKSNLTKYELFSLYRGNIISGGYVAIMDKNELIHGDSGYLYLYPKTIWDCPLKYMKKGFNFKLDYTENDVKKLIESVLRDGVDIDKTVEYIMKTINIAKNYGSILLYNYNVNGYLLDSLFVNGYKDNVIGLTTENGYKLFSKDDIKNLIPYDEFIQIYENAIQYKDNPLLYVNIGINVKCCDLTWYDLLYSNMEHFKSITGKDVHKSNIVDFYKYYRERKPNAQKSANFIPK